MNADPYYQPSLNDLITSLNISENIAMNDDWRGATPEQFKARLAEMRTTMQGIFGEGVSMSFYSSGGKNDER